MMHFLRKMRSFWCRWTTKASLMNRIHCLEYDLKHSQFELHCQKERDIKMLEGYVIESIQHGEVRAKLRSELESLKSFIGEQGQEIGRLCTLSESMKNNHANLEYQNELLRQDLRSRSSEVYQLMKKVDDYHPLKNDCPCTMVEPCQKNCTCAKPHMSHGCYRCCRYGSDEQRLNKARYVVELETILKRIQSGCPHNEIKGGVFGETCQKCGTVIYDTEGNKCQPTSNE